MASHRALHANSKPWTINSFATRGPIASAWRFVLGSSRMCSIRNTTAEPTITLGNFAVISVGQTDDDRSVSAATRVVPRKSASNISAMPWSRPKNGSLQSWGISRTPVATRRQRVLERARGPRRSKVVLDLRLVDQQVGDKRESRKRQSIYTLATPTPSGALTYRALRRLSARLLEAVSIIANVVVQSLLDLCRRHSNQGRQVICGRYLTSRGRQSPTASLAIKAYRDEMVIFNL